MPHLTSISLQNAHRVSDEGLEALGHCQAPLQHLNLKSCRLMTDRGLAALVRMSHLTDLSLQVSLFNDQSDLKLPDIHSKIMSFQSKHQT